MKLLTVKEAVTWVEKNKEGTELLPFLRQLQSHWWRYNQFALCRLNGKHVLLPIQYRYGCQESSVELILRSIDDESSKPVDSIKINMEVLEEKAFVKDCPEFGHGEREAMMFATLYVKETKGMRGEHHIPRLLILIKSEC